MFSAFKASTVPWELLHWSFHRAQWGEIVLRENIWDVFCFRPSLIGLQRAGSVCVMKFVLLICFHTLQPAACPQPAANSHVLVHDSNALVARRRGAANVQAAPTSTRARLHDCEPFIKHADANEHQRVNIFTRSTLSDQSQLHGCVFNSSCFKTKSEFHHLFCLTVLLKSQIGVRFICAEDSQELSSDEPPAVLLWWTSPWALGEGENVWGHSVWPLAAAAGPPLVKSQNPKPSSSHHLPQMPQPLCPAWPLHLQAYSSEAFYWFITHSSSHR